LNDNLIHRIMVIKGDKSKALFLSTASACHEFYHFDFSILFKIILQVMFFNVFFNAANKDLFHI
jgi:hypothetical protein